MADNAETLGDILRKKIPEAVASQFSLPPVASAELKDAIDARIGAVITALGKVIESNMDAAITKKHGKRVDAQVREDTVAALGDILAEKFSAAITQELKAESDIVKASKELNKKLDEIAEGYRQFSEDDIGAVSSVAIDSAIENGGPQGHRATERTRRLAAIERAKAETPAPQLAARTPARSSPRSSSGSSWSGKGSSRSWGGK